MAALGEAGLAACDASGGALVGQTTRQARRLADEIERQLWEEAADLKMNSAQLCAVASAASQAVVWRLQAAGAQIPAAMPVPSGHEPCHAADAGLPAAPAAFEMPVALAESGVRHPYGHAVRAAPGPAVAVAVGGTSRSAERKHAGGLGPASPPKPHLPGSSGKEASSPAPLPAADMAVPGNSEGAPAQGAPSTAEWTLRGGKQNAAEGSTVIRAQRGREAVVAAAGALGSGALGLPPPAVPSGSGAAGGAPAAAPQGTPLNAPVTRTGSPPAPAAAGALMRQPRAQRLTRRSNSRIRRVVTVPLTCAALCDELPKELLPPPLPAQRRSPSSGAPHPQAPRAPQREDSFTAPATQLPAASSGRVASVGAALPVEQPARGDVLLASCAGVLAQQPSTARPPPDSGALVLASSAQQPASSAGRPFPAAGREVPASAQQRAASTARAVPIGEAVGPSAAQQSNTGAARPFPAAGAVVPASAQQCAGDTAKAVPIGGAMVPAQRPANGPSRLRTLSQGALSASFWVVPEGNQLYRCLGGLPPALVARASAAFGAAQADVFGLTLRAETLGFTVDAQARFAAFSSRMKLLPSEAAAVLGDSLALCAADRGTAAASHLLFILMGSPMLLGPIT